VARPSPPSTAFCGRLICSLHDAGRDQSGDQRSPDRHRVPLALTHNISPIELGLLLRRCDGPLYLWADTPLVVARRQTFSFPHGTASDILLSNLTSSVSHCTPGTEIIPFGRHLPFHSSALWRLTISLFQVSGHRERAIWPPHAFLPQTQHPTMSLQEPRLRIAFMFLSTHHYLTVN